MSQPGRCYQENADDSARPHLWPLQASNCYGIAADRKLHHRPKRLVRILSPNIHGCAARRTEGCECIKDGHIRCSGQDHSCQKDLKCIPGGCAPRDASACPSGNGRYCKAPETCAEGLDGKEACYTEEALARLNSEKEKRKLAASKAARDERDRMAEDEFAKKHSGMSYEEWLASQRQSADQLTATRSPEDQCRYWAYLCSRVNVDTGMNCDTEFAAIGFSPQCVEKTGVPIGEWIRRSGDISQTSQGMTYLDRMVAEVEADLAEFLKRAPLSDVDRAAAIALAEQFGASITGGNTRDQNSSYERIEQLANSPNLAGGIKDGSADTAMLYPRAKSPCEVSDLLCDNGGQLSDIARLKPENEAIGETTNSWVQDWAAGGPGNSNVTGFEQGQQGLPPGVSLSEQVLPFDKQKAAEDLPILELSQRAYHSPYSKEGAPPPGWEVVDPPPGWEVVDRGVVDDPKTGFRAVTYRRQSDGKIVVAIAGTNDWRDGVTDFLRDGLTDMEALFLKLEVPAQFDQARSFIADIRKEYGTDVDCTGHSLGGGACAYAAASLPAGVHATVLNPITPGYLVTKPTSRVDNYVVQGDVARKWYGERFDKGLLGNIYMVEAGPLEIPPGPWEPWEIHKADSALNNIARQAGVQRASK